MRSESVYEVECLCGRVFETKSGDPFSCPTCGRILVVVLRETPLAANPPEEQSPVCLKSATTTN